MSATACLQLVRIGQLQEALNVPSSMETAVW